ncbi:hypothetical protein AB0L63_04850 [Nocardia sp. NPDC051990]|uniref:hypothetical protein n=1 Tax=Nocardia sp. NPDC051990 TaxID=3155285 RepID=UPI0034295319
MVLRGPNHLTRTEGIIPAPESAHAVGYVLDRLKWGGDPIPKLREHLSAAELARVD